MYSKLMWVLFAVFGFLLTSSNDVTAASEFEGVTLTVASYGGKWDETQTVSIAERLKKQYGIEVIYRPGVAIQHIARAVIMKDHPEFDLMFIDSPNMPRAIDAGIIDEVTEKDVPSLQNIYREAREFGNRGVPIVFSPFGLAYNTNRIKTPPTAYADLWNPEYKGKVALFDLTNDAGVVTLLAVATSLGGGVNNVEPAFAKLKTLRPNLVTVSPSTEAIAQLLQQEEAWVAPLYSGRTLVLKNQGVPVKLVIPKDGAYTTIVYLNVVKGSPKRAAALKYVELAIDEEAQLAIATRSFYPPTNRTVKLPANISDQLPFYGAENVRARTTVDWAAVAKNRPAWIERWHQELGM